MFVFNLGNGVAHSCRICFFGFVYRRAAVLQIRGCIGPIAYGISDAADPCIKYSMGMGRESMWLRSADSTAYSWKAVLDRRL